MPTSIELENFGDTLQAAGLAINATIAAGQGTLNFNQIQALSKSSQDLLVNSKTMYENATIAIADEAKGAISDLNKASNDIATVIKNIQAVQTALDIAAKLVSLAGAVMSGDAGKIVSGAQDIVTEVSGAIGK
jgi:hypothetical protein